MIFDSDMQSFTTDEKNSLKLLVESREHDPTKLLNPEELALLKSNNYERACW